MKKKGILDWNPPMHKLGTLKLSFPNGGFGLSEDFDGPQFVKELYGLCLKHTKGAKEALELLMWSTKLLVSSLEERDRAKVFEEIEDYFKKQGKQ